MLFASSLLAGFMSQNLQNLLIYESMLLGVEGNLRVDVEDRFGYTKTEKVLIVDTASIGRSLLL